MDSLLCGLTITGSDRRCEKLAFSLVPMWASSDAEEAAASGRFLWMNGKSKGGSFSEAIGASSKMFQIELLIIVCSLED
jgi:hypothetical protein